MKPSISIVTTNFNSNLTLFRQVLSSIDRQNYPKHLIEHIVMDGGSTNGSIELAREFGCKVIVRKDLQEEINARMYVGIQKAKNTIIAIIETDNPLPSKEWLNRMVEPFVKEKEIFCTFNTYNSFTKDMSLMTKYCALFGVSDPVLYYLGKSEKMSWHNLRYTKGKALKKYSGFTKVKFDNDTLPTLGDNGCLIRKNVFMKTTMKAKNFIHLDLFAELLDQGYDTFGAVNIGIGHVTGSNIITMIKRRLAFRNTFFEKRKHERKYLVYNPHTLKDRLNILKYCFFSITLIEPLYQSIRGYVKKQELAWFLHPIMCYIFLVGYAKYEIMKRIRS
jgi:glycosyltransferase involved in cell wall biosynthesis